MLLDGICTVEAVLVDGVCTIEAVLVDGIFTAWIVTAGLDGSA